MPRTPSTPYRSGLEDRIAAQIEARGLTPDYETTRINYVRPATQHCYTPDFVLANGIIVETKGRLDAEDRKKHLLLKEQHPDLDVRFVFSNSRTRIRKGSPTTYGMWCEKHGIPYADKTIPSAWFDEA